MRKNSRYAREDAVLERWLRKSPFFGSDQVILQKGKRMIMENCKQVIFCDRTRVVLLGSVRLEVAGENLTLIELGNENVEVRGRITQILVEESR